MSYQCKYLTTTLFFWFFCLNLYGQPTEYIQGKVLDLITKEPISFAFIILNQNNIGIVANEEGDFKININSKFLSDTLKISCIGYQTKLIKFNELISNNINNIFLSQSYTELDEVKIVALKKKISSKALIKKAIKNIRTNYSIDPFSYVSYYREYQKKDYEYLNLNEAIIHTKDYGFNTYSSDSEIRLLDYKKDTFFNRRNINLLYDTIAKPNYFQPNKFIPNAYLPNQGGNEFFILMAHDPIRRYQSKSFSFIDRFSKDFLRNHRFSEVELVYNDDLLLLKIKFIAKELIDKGPGVGLGKMIVLPKEDSSDNVTAFGEIYIQPNDYSIHKINYTCLEKKSNKELYNIKIEYGYTEHKGSKMRLKYISFNNLFKIIDVTDAHYFKIVKRNLVKQKKSFLEIKMNNKVDIASVENKELYTIMGDGNKLKVENVHVIDSTIVVHFNHKDYENIDYRINTKGFKDIDGNPIYQKKMLEFYQFRELFVQEYNDSLKFKDHCYLKNKPLSKNCISTFYSENKYWMNTPIGIKNETE
jgi:hypothetical protein